MGKKKPPRSQPPSDPLRDDILFDLREFRRMPGHPRSERLAALPFLTEYLGDGSEQQAHSALLELRRTHGSTAGSDIHAFFYTSGYNVGLGTLEARTIRYAETHHVNESTALRRSNRGASKLAHLIRDGSELARPWGTLVVVQDGTVAVVGVTLDVMKDQTYRRPKVYINGGPREMLKFELQATEGRPSLLTSTEVLRDVPVDLQAGAGDSLLTVEVRWRMPVWPTWMVTGQVRDSRVHVRLECAPNGMARVDLRWFREETAEHT